MTEIKTCSFGIANYYSDSDTIEINEKLYEPEFSSLLSKVIKHEREHSRTKGFLGNRKIDAKTELTFKDIFPFVKKYPESFIQQYTPISYRNETLYFEWSLIILYGIILSIIGLTLYVVLSISTKPSFLFDVFKYFVMMIGIYLILSYFWKQIKKSVNEREVTKK